MTATMRGLLPLARPKGRFAQPFARVAALGMPLLGALALATAHPSHAAAQVTTTTPTSTNQAIDSNLVVKRGGKIIKNGTLVYGDIADCGGDGPVAVNPQQFEFSVTYTTNVPVVEAWLGVGASENCAMSANRLRSNSTAGLPPVCTFLGAVSTNTRNPVIPVPGNQLFNQSATGWTDPGDTAKPLSKMICDAVSGGQTYTVYFLPLQTPTTNVNASEPITVGVLSTLKAVFTPFTRRPEPPANLSGRSGESEVGVSFKSPSSSMTLTKYKAYFDVTGGTGTGGKGLGDGADAGSDAGLDAGSDASIDASAEAGSEVVDDAGAVATSDAGLGGGLDAAVDAATKPVTPATTDDAGTGTVACGSGYLENNPVPLFNLSTSILRESSTSSSTSVDLTDMTGIPVGTPIAVAAVAIDPAGNESKLSNPICVQRINTIGFLDACDQTPGCRDGLQSCSLSPGKRGSAWELSLLGLALAALIRRRRHA